MTINRDSGFRAIFYCSKIAYMSDRRCQVPGCVTALPGARYYHRYNICKEHAFAWSVTFHGRGAYRWCQQCGHFQALDEFDAGRRTCRVQLARHNARRRCKRRNDQSASTKDIETTEDTEDTE